MKYLVTINIPQWINGKPWAARGVFRNRIYANQTINLWLTAYPDALINLTKIAIPFNFFNIFKISNFDKLEVI